MPRISLRKIDSLLNGDLSAEESARLQVEIEASPQAKAYVERQRALRSELSWERLRKPVRVGRPSFVRPGFRELLDKFWYWVIGSRRGWIPYTAGALGLIALGGTIWTLYRSESSGRESIRWAAKGSSSADVRLQIRGQDYDAGSSVRAATGDTLGLIYRSQDTVWVHAWFRESGGEISPFPGKANGMLILPPSMTWITAPQRILLKGKWRSQEVWLVVSRRPLEGNEIRAAIGTPGNTGGAEVLAFYLAPGS
jgi:hypothetical protein